MPGLGREALPGTGHSDHYISQALKELEQLVLGPISSRNGPWRPKALMNARRWEIAKDSTGSQCGNITSTLLCGCVAGGHLRAFAHNGSATAIPGFNP
jgi:hypothetical protein